MTKLLNGSVQGEAMRQDLLAGFHTLPAWMQAIVRELPGCAVPTAEAAMSRPGTDYRAHTETFA
ncbi:hypothetical protein [Pusillimonas sp. T7-7]|uniref:hypothetical protein n=1 Tax=Pusillimonas sp. (strain T7-7) TaxID=1007105 RepID=UPI001D178FE9|nr:hypothetical protein [Pusillimonas sp. T7-7]